MAGQANSIPLTMGQRRERFTHKRLRKKCSLICDKVRENTDEFLMNTTLHGLKYVNNVNFCPIERSFFGLSFIIVFLLSGYFIQISYEKWSTTPIILSINPEPTFITEEPFPAVTLCNLNQASKRKVKGFSEHSVEFAMIQMLCRQEVNVSIAETITNWNNIEEFIVNNSQSCEDMILACRFGGEDYNCSDIFKAIVTDAGMCCVFNVVDPKFMYINSYVYQCNSNQWPSMKKIFNYDYPLYRILLPKHDTEVLKIQDSDMP